jgi:hypothetical protein
VNYPSSSKKKSVVWEPRRLFDSEEDDSDEDAEEETTDYHSTVRLSKKIFFKSVKLISTRQTCARCYGAAADLLLQKYRPLKRRRRSLAAKRKRNSMPSSRSGSGLETMRQTPDESSEDEQEANYRLLGSWVKCAHCMLAFHFACLPSPVQKEVRSMSRSEIPVESGKKANKLELDPKARFVLNECPTCAKPKGADCMYCHKEEATEGEATALF